MVSIEPTCSTRHNSLIHYVPYTMHQYESVLSPRCSVGLVSYLSLGHFDHFCHHVDRYIVGGSRSRFQGGPDRYATLELRWEACFMAVAGVIRVEV